jgi:hypothetical protein
MEFIFAKLPNDIIQNIITFDKHFIMRKGNLISIIPKDDYRYDILHVIIPRSINTKKIDEKISYTYDLVNIYDIPERKYMYVKNDIIQIRIQNKEDCIYYKIFICKLKPYFNTINEEIYCWYNIAFEYTRY